MYLTYFYSILLLLSNFYPFIDYKNNEIELRKNLVALLEKAKEITPDAYSLVSRENLTDAIENAETLINDGLASNDELENAASMLQRSINNLTFSHGEDTQKGALNVTAGKVIAAVIMGIIILSAQIYTYKMQKRKKKI